MKTYPIRLVLIDFSWGFFCCFSWWSDHPGVESSGQVEKFQEKALMELQDYVQKTYPEDTYRSVNVINSWHEFFQE